MSIRRSNQGMPGRRADGRLLSRIVGALMALGLLCGTVAAGTSAVAEETVRQDVATSSEVAAEPGADAAGSESEGDGQTAGDVEATDAASDGAAKADAEADQEASTQPVDKQAAAVPAPSAVQAAAEPRSIAGIRAVMANANAPLPGERPTNPTDDSYITINQNTAGVNSQTGALFSDIVADAGEAQVTGRAYGMKYVYWRAVLLGSDGDENYGPDGATQPWEGNTYYADSGVTVTKVRYQDGQLQFMPAAGEDNAGQWVSINGNGRDLQLVLYYLQINPLGDYVNLEYSHWGVNRYTTAQGGSPKAVMGQVVDADSGEVLANGKPMYWYYDHTGVKNVYVSEQNLGDYEIVRAEKYDAKDQVADSWDGTDSYGKDNQDYLGDKTQEYSVDDILSKSMSTDWDKNGNDDANHVIFRIYVRKTAQASLVKQLAGNNVNDYTDKEFTFSATVTLPEKSDSTLRDTYPIEGTVDGSASVHMVVSADGKSGTVTGIQAKPSQKVTLKGLPYGATVKFTETGVPTQDPSVFTTTYTNDKTQATDGTATAKHKDGKNDDAPQTVTATNTVNDGSGKLTVTKTFKGLSNLTALEREDLYNAFQITSTENKIPALTLKNASSNSGDILADDVSADITYTWTMKKLATGSVTLTEENYTVGGKGVTTESQVSADGAAFRPSAETDITTETKTVAFTNEYGTTNKDVKIRKAWAEGVTNDQKKPVTVQLNWTGTVDGAKGTQGKFTLSKDNGWTTTVKDLPQHTGTYGDITWSIAETKVGDTALENSDFEAAYDTKDGILVVTNSLKFQVPYSPFKITKELDGAPLNAGQFRFQVNAMDRDSAVKAGFPTGASDAQQVVDCKDTGAPDGDGVTDQCVFTNREAGNTNTSALARNANTLKFTMADANHTYTYEYKELTTDAHNQEYPDAYVLDKNTYRVTVSVKDVSTETGGLALEITTTVKKSDAKEPSWDHIDPIKGSPTVVTLSEDGPTSDARATVPFVNEFSPISALPLTGGSTDRQWLVTGLGLGGMALLLAGAAGIWRNRQRLI